MIRRLKIKFVCINMLIVTVMLSVIFGMVLGNTRRNMEEQGNRTLQSIHEELSHRGPVMRWNRVPFFAVVVSPDGELSLQASTFLDSAEETDLLNIARTVYESGEMQGVLDE